MTNEITIKRGHAPILFATSIDDFTNTRQVTVLTYRYEAQCIPEEEEI